MTDFSRRDTMTLALAGLTAGAPLFSACATIGNGASVYIAPQGAALKDMARDKGMRFGTAFGSDALTDPDYLALIKSECGIMVPENELKLYTIRPDTNGFQFSRGDALIDWGKSHGLDIRGHVLLWNRSDFTPDWVGRHDFGADKNVGMHAFMDDYVRRVIQHFGNRIYSWDVVNESIDPATGKMRDTIFTQLGGDEIVDFMFHKAREYAPHAQLVYNDYMIWEPGNEKHRTGVLKLLEGFRKRGTPIDAFGVQSHLGTEKIGNPVSGYPDPQRKEWRAFIDEIVGMDYQLVLSEFDVNDTNIVADEGKRDRLVADYGKAYLDFMLSYPQVRDIMAWGLSDKYTWLKTWWPRDDGLAKRPALFDVNNQPKPLYHAVAQALKSAPIRSFV